jgi:hypothetical protein
MSARHRSRVRLPYLAPKFVGKSSSGKTEVFEAFNLGSIPGFPTSANVV